MGDEPLDEELLAKVMSCVRLEARYPMRLRMSKEVNGKETDAHTFEVSAHAEVSEVQREVTKVGLRWKGGFPVGTRFVVERLE